MPRSPGATRGVVVSYQTLFVSTASPVTTLNDVCEFAFPPDRSYVSSKGCAVPLYPGAWLAVLYVEAPEPLISLLLPDLSDHSLTLAPFATVVPSAFTSVPSSHNTSPAISLGTSSSCSSQIPLNVSS